MRAPFASRLSHLPAYLFQELDELKAQTRGDLIDLGEGSPDQPTPRPILAAFTRALRRTENHRYPTYAGKARARQAVADWYRRRFGVVLDPDSEVTMLLGSKEGVAHLIWGVCGPGDVVAVCEPSYPVYPNQCRLAGATPVAVPLEEHNGFLPDLDWLSRHAHRLKLVCINYPNNPTAATARLDFYQTLVALAMKHGFYVVNDNVYSEIYFGAVAPPSILEVPAAHTCCVEFHSLSKSFNMAGWRIGMAVGNRQLIQALLKIKRNTDSGPFGAIQDAATVALRRGTRLTAAIRRMYRQRRDTFCTELQKAGWPVAKPEATFFVWARLPDWFRARKNGSRSWAFVERLLLSCRVMAAPGNGFGAAGEGYVRFALVQPEAQLRKAAVRIGRWLNSGAN